jgi:flagellar basal-body rod protein FlgB
MQMVSRLLSAAAMRHRAIASNIANANTPGYQRLDVAFEDQFKAALQHGGAAAAARVEPRVVVDASGPARLDGNNVDPERELVDVSRNALLYETFARAAAVKTGILRSAITGT